MKNESKKQPYEPPRITRIVLRREQAILSQCSANKASTSTNGSLCINNGCRNSRKGTADNTIVS